MDLSQLITHSPQYSRSTATAATSMTSKETSPMTATYPGTWASSVSTTTTTATKRGRPHENPAGYSYPPLFPQAPLSPPEEEPSKCSLPSISSLLEGADCIDQENAPSKFYQEMTLSLIPAAKTHLTDLFLLFQSDNDQIQLRSGTGIEGR